MKKSFRLFKIVLVLLLAVSLAPLPAPGARAAEGINQGALLHDSRSDLYRVPGGAVPINSRVVLRFCTAADDVNDVSLRLYNIADQSQTLIPMEVVATTPDGYDLWQTALEVGREPTVYWYRFLVTKGDLTLYYEDDTRPDGGNYYAANEGGVGAAYEQSPDLSYQITVYDPAYYTPEWMRNAVIYQIFPDRFRNGDTSNDPADGSDVFYGELSLIFHETWNEPPVDGRVTTTDSGQGYYNSDFFGGDLAGIIEKLDYLQELGVTAIYLNPIFEARSNHRYDTADFLKIDPLLGDMETFRTLVQEAEARGITLILDGVFNHLSSDSAFFDRYHRFDTDGACESLTSKYRSWFFFVAPRAGQPDACVDNPDGATYYVSWAGFDSIPKINNDQIEPRKYFFLDENSVARVWGEAGIGGWRLDVAGDIDSGGPDSPIYWEAFRSVLRQINPESVIIGEEWADASRWLLGKEWDSTMNYRLRAAVLGFVRDEDYMDNDANGDRILYALTPSEVMGTIRSIEEDYPPMAYHAMLNLLDSHDTSRLFFVVGNDPQRQKLAALLQFTLPGAPTVYYGDEIALDAPSIPDSGGNLQDDPYNRAPYPWPDTTGDTYPAPDEDMLSYYQAIAALRHANPALREGKMITLRTDDETGVLAFLRLDDQIGNAALVVLNSSDEDQTVELSLMGLLPARMALEPAFGGEPVTAAGTDPVTVTVSANSGNVWAVTAGAPFEAPRAPVNVVAQGEMDRVVLTWDASASASGYMVYRSPVSYGGFEPITEQPVTEAGFVDETVTNGFRYYYAVATVGADGLLGKQGASYGAIPTAEIGSVFYVGDDEGDPEIEHQPTALPLTVGVTVNLEVGIRIDGVTDGEGAAQGVLAEAALVPADMDLAEAEWTSMQYIDELNGADVYTAALAPQAPGEYVSVARFSTNAGESWQIAVYRDGTFPMVSVEAPSDTTPPAPVPAVQISRASLSGVILTWEPSADEDVFVYRVYRTGEDGETTLLVEVPASEGTKYVDKAVVGGKTYTYAVTAVDTALNESEPASSEAATVELLMVPVTLVVEVPDYTEGDVYVAGSFGQTDYPNWDPGGLVMEQVDDTHWQITLELPEGAKIEYKFVRGTWDAVEKGADCEEIANRQAVISLSEDQNALSLDHVVQKWRDLDACG